VHYHPETAALVVEDAGFHVFGLCKNAEPVANVLCRDEPGMQGWTMDHDLLRISYPQEDVAIPSHEVNRSIAALAKPLQLRPWHGPVIIVAICPNPAGQYCLVDNLRWRDITTAAIYFRTHLHNPAWPLAPNCHTAQPALQLTGQKNWSVAAGSRAPSSLATVNVLAGQPYLWKRCMAAYRLGLDWWVCSANGSSRRDVDRAENENEDARWLK
jgi:hypothetical protein